MQLNNEISSSAGDYSNDDEAILSASLEDCRSNTICTSVGHQRGPYSIVGLSMAAEQPKLVDRIRSRMRERLGRCIVSGSVLVSDATRVCEYGESTVVADCLLVVAASAAACCWMRLMM